MTLYSKEFNTPYRTSKYVHFPTATHLYSSLIRAHLFGKSTRLIYPFVDLLGDGYSSFVYEKYNLIDAAAIAAIAGSASYGESAVPSVFDPPNEPYAYVPKATHEIYADTFTTNSSCPSVSTKYKLEDCISPWPLELYVSCLV